MIILVLRLIIIYYRVSVPGSVVFERRGPRCGDDFNDNFQIGGIVRNAWPWCHE